MDLGSHNQEEILSARLCNFALPAEALRHHDGARFLHTSASALTDESQNLDRDFANARAESIFLLRVYPLRRQRLKSHP